MECYRKFMFDFSRMDNSETATFLAIATALSIVVETKSRKQKKARIRRPYEDNLITENGDNRITWANLGKSNCKVYFFLSTCTFFQRISMIGDISAPFTE